jgi:hypothetical protein
MVTTVPTGPDTGLKPLMDGGGPTPTSRFVRVETVDASPPCRYQISVPLISWKSDGAPPLNAWLFEFLPVGPPE